MVKVGGNLLKRNGRDENDRSKIAKSQIKRLNLRYATYMSPGKCYILMSLRYSQL